MPGLVPGIHVFVINRSNERKTWMAATSTAMTVKVCPMNKTTAKSLPASIDATLDLLARADYLADRSLATVLFLALRMGRPLFLEGEAGVGKTEIAKVLSATLGRRLIRLQC